MYVEGERRRGVVRLVVAIVQNIPQGLILLVPTRPRETSTRGGISALITSWTSTHTAQESVENSRMNQVWGTFPN